MTRGGGKKRIFVGLSGGVDSSVAALRLKQAGHDVVGVFIKVWHPDFLPCNWEAERLDAMRVAAHLDIPFLTCDAEAAYRDSVAQYFIDGYAKGETPNPDVMCNKYVKFGAFFDFARAHGAHGIATGHYAEVVAVGGTYTLLRGKDQNKDQSYFLWTIKNELLPYIHLPIGNSLKEDVRKEAQRHGLPTAVKKDSQGICFLGHVDIPEFISHYITLVPGDVHDTEGNIIGRHSGVQAYTIGQRHGFTIHAQNAHTEACYIIKKDIANNTLIVATNKPTYSKSIALAEVNWLMPLAEVEGAAVTVQTRYRQQPASATVHQASKSTVRIKLSEPIDSPTLGQSCVMYQDRMCIGGGIINSVEE